MRCPHCGFEFEEASHCPNCGRAPGKPGRNKTYYKEPKKEPQKPAQTSEPEVQQGDTQVFTRESRPKQPPVVQVPTVQQQPAPQTANWQTRQQTKSTPSKPKKKIDPVWIGVACIVIVVIGVAVALSVTREERLYRTTFASSEEEATVLDDGTKVYDDIKVIDVIPAGTWKTEDKSLKITIDSDNSVSWVRIERYYTPDIQQEKGTEYNTVSKWEYPVSHS